ncbi:MAG: hypothetical protein JNK26_03220 [Candidatus Doudnabacteria bacterium]|nr:hypothetical protein [Candidatus Doudnabacteria bacterium]
MALIFMLQISLTAKAFINNLISVKIHQPKHLTAAITAEAREKKSSRPLRVSPKQQ